MIWKFHSDESLLSENAVNLLQGNLLWCKPQWHLWFLSRSQLKGSDKFPIMAIHVLKLNKLTLNTQWKDGLDWIMTAISSLPVRKYVQYPNSRWVYCPEQLLFPEVEGEQSVGGISFNARKHKKKPRTESEHPSVATVTAHPTKDQLTTGTHTLQRSPHDDHYGTSHTSSANEHPTTFLTSHTRQNTTEISIVEQL